MSGVTNSRINGIHVNGTCRLRGSIDKLYSSIFIHRFRLFTFLDLFIHTIACIYLFTFPLFTHFPLFIYIFSQLQLPLYNPSPPFIYMREGQINVRSERSDDKIFSRGETMLGRDQGLETLLLNRSPRARGEKAAAVPF